MKLTETRFRFGTKAETLSRLSSTLSLSAILPTYYFSILEWKENPTQILQKIMDFGKSQALIIRSSAQNEDGSVSSMAGAFESCLDVPSDDAGQIQDAIENVIHSYTEERCNEDQVLIQPMLQDVDICGVIMTHDLELGAPYYVINYDDESGLTDTITGGTGIQKTVLIYRNVERNLIRSRRLRKVIEATQELEKQCGDLPLDVEFALNKSGQLYILQVRRISLSNTWHPVTERRVARKLEYVRDFVARRSKQRSGIYGDKTLLGVMPDWNPAEMIGTSPSPLASSLYRLLITRDVWRLARQKMGYYNPENEELMTIIDHHPYIDVRNSFNSFLPAKLSSAIKHKLINAWIERLTLCPELHDKVEFTVAQTCVDFTFDLDFKERFQGILSELEYQEFRDHLWQLTKECLNSKNQEGSLVSALSMIDELDKYHESQKNNKDNDHLAKAAELLFECRRLGTMGFSIIARHAFIAEGFLHSAAKLNVLSKARIQEFKSSLKTVTSHLTSDYEAVCSGALPSSEFLAQFGHLRPGTYDITSLRYDERIDLFNSTSDIPISHRETKEFKLSLKEKAGLDALLKQHKYEINTEQLLHYASTAIINREHGKFIFTKCLSDALNHLSLWGVSVGLAKEDVANLDIDVLLNLSVSPVLDDVDRVLLNTAIKSKQSVNSSKSLKLSHLITNIDDVYVVPLHRSMPNFITQTKVEGPIILLQQNTPATINLSGFIVCIENADPGYDWIFTKDIAGLVTQFGGANSHMAIRCAEFSIAAAIGCGEQVFNRIISKGRVVINCAEKTLKNI
jgi:hypothetical protein